MAKKAIVLLAGGFEEVEAVTPVDYLRRAGIEVYCVAVGENPVTGSHGIVLQADAVLAEMMAEGPSPLCESFDAVLLPGGMAGAGNLAASKEAGALISAMARKKLVAAICASPAVVLAPLALLQGRRFTCFPGMEERVSGAEWSEDRVVIDGNIITSRAAGTAAAWSAAIIEKLEGPQAAKELSDSVLL